MHGKQQNATAKAKHKKNCTLYLVILYSCIHFNSMCMTMQNKNTNNCISIVSFQLLFVTTLIKVH